MSAADDDELYEVRLVVDELFLGLPSQPYHVFLGVAESTTGDDLRHAFHERAALLHPDQYYELADLELKAKIYAVYKRITEAYRVLGDPELRARYAAQRTAGHHRLESTDRPSTGPRPGDQAVTNPTARKHFQLGLEAERRADARTARLNFQLAFQLEPGNPVIQEKVEKYK